MLEYSDTDPDQVQQLRTRYSNTAPTTLSFFLGLID